MILNKQQRKSAFLTIIKLCVSLFALYLVFKKINLKQIAETLQDINWWFLGLSFIFLNLSQFASTVRLQGLLIIVQINIGFQENLKLYYKGMFYNLFLPGGIGGDGIKAYIFNKQYHQPLKKIISCFILDRLSGLAGLVFLGCLTFVFCKVNPSVQWFKWIIYSLIPLTYPAFFLFVNIFFKLYKTAFIKFSMWGMAVNIMQTFSVIFLFLAIGIKNNFIEYLSVFYFATASMVFPFTVGGIGVRELVFTIAPQFVPVSAQIGVTFCLVFFVLNAISSFAGVFVKTDTTI